MTEVAVCDAATFPDPGRKVFDIGGIEIGVFLRDGVFTAYENVCPHMAGPVCQGKIMPRTLERLAEDRTSTCLNFSKDDANIVCPWHGYEFDIKTGIHQGNARLRLRKVEVGLKEGQLVLTLPEGFAERIALVRAQSLHRPANSASGGEQTPLEMEPS